MTTKAPVSERALLARINRKLVKDGEKLLRCKQSTRAYAELGDYYVVDTGANVILSKNCDLEETGRELGVLAAWEELEAG